MTATTDIAQPADDPGIAARRPSRLNQALAWVGIVAGGLFVVAGIFLAGFFLNWSEHAQVNMGHPAVTSASQDCCADMKHADMKPGGMRPGEMGPR